MYEKANSVATEEVHAPHWLHRFIIGRKGQNVQKITQDLPKVHVEFTDGDTIVLEGPPDQVQQAKDAFDTFTEDLVCMCVCVCICTVYGLVVSGIETPKTCLFLHKALYRDNRVLIYNL